MVTSMLSPAAGKPKGKEVAGKEVVVVKRRMGRGPLGKALMASTGGGERQRSGVPGVRRLISPQHLLLRASALRLRRLQFQLLKKG